jgi:hypothetical protein
VKHRSQQSERQSLVKIDGATRPLEQPPQRRAEVGVGVIALWMHRRVPLAKRGRESARGLAKKLTWAQAADAVGHVQSSPV